MCCNPEIAELRNMHDLFRNYYKDLHGKFEKPCTKADREMLYTKGAAHLQDLGAPFTEDEVKNVVFQLASQKSSGPDRFSIVSYNHFWSSIEDLLELF